MSLNNHNNEWKWKDRNLDLARELKNCETHSWPCYQLQLLPLKKRSPKAWKRDWVGGWRSKEKLWPFRLHQLKYLEESWRPKGTCHHSDFSEKLSCRSDSKNSRRLKMIMIIITYMQVTVIPIVIGALATIPKSLGKRVGRVGNQRISQDHPNYSIVEICQDTEKSPGDLRRLAVT